jgi:acetyl esterase/lipase
MSLRSPATHAALAPLALALTLVPALTDSQKPRPKPTPSFEEMRRLRVVYTLPGADAAIVRKDVVYKTVGETPLHADVYTPPTLGKDDRRPAVIFVHGGPVPTPGIKEWGVFVSYGQLAAASGFVGVTFHHRFFGPGMLPQADEDVADLVEYVRTNASELGVDKSRIAVWAFSGGGPLLARWLGEPPLHLRALVAYYAFLDVPPPPPGAADPLPAEARARLSPLRRAAAPTRPIPLLVARAGLDHPALNKSVDAFTAAALEHNLPLELLNHPEGRHGFDILDNDARSKEILAHTFAFLKTHLE